eukprot:14301047-Alexandrium_andersonii.AAC.1
MVSSWPTRSASAAAATSSLRLSSSSALAWRARHLTIQSASRSAPSVATAWRRPEPSSPGPVLEAA